MTKTCRKCYVEKNIDLFYKATKSKDGHQIYCKECHIAANYANIERVRLAGPVRHPESKVCNICNTNKPISQFGTKTAVLDGKLPYCKPCWIEYVKKAKKRKLLRDSKL